MKIAIVICTYNRVLLLEKCIAALLPQLENVAKRIEIIIVDNNSCDGTFQFVRTIKKKHQCIRYLKEERIGLSYARNKVIEEKEIDWIAYLDDDGIPFDNYVQELCYTIDQFDFTCFGGTYIGYSHREIPQWLPSNFGSKKILSDIITEIESNELSGGIFSVKRSELEKIGGFNTKYGMNGRQMAFSEENDIQLRLRLNGASIGYNPNLRMHHLTAPEKLKLFWHLKYWYVIGRDNFATNKRFVSLTLIFKRCISSILFLFPQLLLRLIKEKDFYIQNLIIELFKPTLYLIGLRSNYYKFKA
jgi:glycosyltransferase involved in cell wall biosynthesis